VGAGRRFSPASKVEKAQKGAFFAVKWGILTEKTAFFCFYGLYDT